MTGVGMIASRLGVPVVPVRLHGLDKVLHHTWKMAKPGRVRVAFGPPLRLDPQMSFALVTGTWRHIIHLANTPFKIELFYLSDDPHDQERFHSRLAVSTLGRETYLPTVEDVIITKVRWYAQVRRNKDRDDVRDVVAVQRDRIDWNYVYVWCDRHGTRATLDEIRRTLPSI